MARRKNQGRHSADSPSWSATKQARDLIEVRDLTIERGRNHPMIIALEAQDLRTGLSTFIAAAQRAGDPNPLGAAIEWSGNLDLFERGISDEAVYASAADEWDRTMDHLADAEPYIISPQMHATTIAAAFTLDLDDAFRIHYSDLPSESGILMFPDHMIVEPPEGGVPQDLIAVSWDLETHTIQGKPTRMLIIRSWLDTHGPVQVEAFTAMLDAAKAAGHRLPPLTKLARTGSALVDDIDSGHIEVDDYIKVMTSASVAPETGLTRDSKEVTAEYDTSAAIPGQDVHTWVRKYLFAFFRLADQQIATVERFRDGVHPSMKHQSHHDTRVVQLRQSSSVAASDGDGTTRRYTHRFVVRMHRANQWYPSLGRHKVIWRGPYIKGPEDAPFVEGIKVNAFTR